MRAGALPGSSHIARQPRVPVDRTPDAYVAFKAGNEYDGSDGCNGVGGRYVIGPAGVILATSGPSTSLGCDNSPLADWASRAGRLGLRGGRLVFVDPDGKELGEAIRAR